MSNANAATSPCSSIPTLDGPVVIGVALHHRGHKGEASEGRLWARRLVAAEEAVRSPGPP